MMDELSTDRGAPTRDAFDMIATIAIADIGVTGVGRSMLWRPKPGDIAGLRWATTAIAAPLATSCPPTMRRAVLIAFWDSEKLADNFLRCDRVGRRFSVGFRTTLRPLRAFGTWPGLPEDVPTARAVHHDGPVAVLTLGRLRLSQVRRFLKTSRPAERAALASPGLIWATAAALPPFVATISFWYDSHSAAAYAYADGGPHAAAVAAQRRKDFHQQSAFIRFHPVEAHGSLTGRNPLPDDDVTERLRP